MLTDTMHGKVLTHFRPVSPSNAWFSAIRCSVVRDKRSTARSEHPACPAVCNNAERNTGYTWGQRRTSKHLQHARLAGQLPDGSRNGDVASVGVAGAQAHNKKYSFQRQSKTSNYPLQLLLCRCGIRCVTVSSM